MSRKTVQYDIKYDDVIEFKRRKQARHAVHRAIRAKTLIKPACCDLCGQESKTDAHHIDYGKPLDVKWLCRTCHGIAHTEGHEWNPDCNEQTGKEDIDLTSDDFIRVNFSIPAKEYLQLMMECEERKITLACRLRQVLMEKVRVEDDSLNLNLEDDNDESQHAQHARVSGMEPNEAGLPEPKVKPLSEPRSEGNIDMSRVDRRLWPLLQGNGANARELQRA